MKVEKVQRKTLLAALAVSRYLLNAELPMLCGAGLEIRGAEALAVCATLNSYGSQRDDGVDFTHVPAGSPSI